MQAEKLTLFLYTKNQQHDKKELSAIEKFNKQEDEEKKEREERLLDKVKLKTYYLR